jgi:uncharacterized protein (TIGR01615 family)
VYATVSEKDLPTRDEDFVGRKKRRASLCPSMDPASSKVSAVKAHFDRGGGPQGPPGMTTTTSTMMEFQNPGGKDDGAYFDDLLFDEPPVPERTRERASYYVERRRRDSREGSSDPQGEEEYEEMKDANAVRRLSRPETDLERAALEIVKKTISKRRDNKGAGTSDHAHPPPSLNGRRLSGENEPPRRASEDEEREREKCVKLKEEIQEMFIRENRTKREVHVTTSSKFRGACALRNLVHSYVWIDPENNGGQEYNEVELMTMQQQQQHVIGAASSYSSQTTMMMHSALPPNEFNLQRIIVEADLRSHFVIANATPQYQRLLDELPSEFVGTFSRLLEIIDFMAVKLNSSFVARKMDTPPWRRAKSIASKWSMPIEEHHVVGSVSGSPSQASATTTTAHHHQQQQNHVAINKQTQHQHHDISPQTVLNKKKDTSGARGFVK